MPPGTIILIDPQGEAREVPSDAAASALDSGWRAPTEADRLGRLGQQATDEDYGGVGGGVGAAVAGGLRGATLGLSDVAMRGLGGEQARMDLEGMREANPGISTASEIGGAIAPALLSGGALTPAGAAARLGRGITELGEGAGALGRIGAATAGGAAEGALYGTGAGVSELALSDDPLTLEHVASTLSSNALFGAATGGVTGGAFKAGELGLARAKKGIDAVLERSAQDQAIAAGAVSPADVDVSLLDRAGLRAARSAELDTLEAQRAPLRSEWVDGLQGEREMALKKQIWRATEGAADRETRSIGKAYVEADIKIDRLLKDRVSLAEHPERALGPLRQQEQALGKLEAMRAAESDAFERAVADAPTTIRQEVLDNKIKGYVVGKGGLRADSPLIDQAVEHEIERRYGNLANPTRPKRLQYLDQVPDAIQANRTLQDELAGLVQPPTSARLGEIASAEDALAGPHGKSLTEHVINAIPFAGPLGTLASLSKKAIGGLRGAAGKAAARTAAAASSFLGTASKAASKAAPYAPVVATKVLGALSYAPPPPSQPRTTRDKAEPPPTKMDLAGLFKARTDEIKSQVSIAPDGSFQMRPESRQALAERLRPVAATDPRAADQLETMAARRIEYLASIMPRLPDFGVMQIGPDRRRVSDQEMRTWARAAGALENPEGVFERARHGKVVPAEAAALRAVMPGKLDAFTQQVIQGLPDRKRGLPRAQQLSLWVLTGVPIDASQTPAVLGVIQGMYASEPGTQGGTQAPTPQPQFGSVKADKGTAAQQRQGENT